MSTTLELQPTTSRWRALTHAHARTIVPSSKNRSPFETLTETNIRGILVILVLSGCTDPRAVHHEPLRERFGPAIARISERAERLMLAMREGVMSAAFDVIWHGYKSGLKSSVGGKPDEDSAELFDKVRMENVYAGHGKENGEVLCTVEFGMVCTRRVVKEVNKANGVNGVNGVVNGVNGLNGHSASNGNMNGHSHGHTGQNGMTNGHAKRPSVPEAVFAKNLLLKPKVLLRSVEEILWPQT